nr:hypothetical protein [Leptospira mayottensis]
MYLAEHAKTNVMMTSEVSNQKASYETTRSRKFQSELFVSHTRRKRIGGKGADKLFLSILKGRKKLQKLSFGSKTTECPKHI